MYNNSIFKQILLAVCIVLFVSCDKDYSEIGEGLIGENHFDLNSNYYNVTAYNQKIGAIQSNNLPVNALGIYNNPAFGKTTASFATQVQLVNENPTINTDLKQQVQSVYLDIPYFVDVTKTTPISTGGNTYVLDSIYGQDKAKIKLSVYESGRYMGNQTGVGQLFYTDDTSEFDTNKKGNRLNDDADKTQNDEFFFDNAQHVTTTKDDTGKETKTYTAPGMRLKLNNSFFENKILKASASDLVTNAAFERYFKGLYFKVEQSGSDAGSLAMLNFAKGTITINYKEDTSTTVTTKVAKTIVLNLTGTTASLLEQSNTKPEYLDATKDDSLLPLEDERLYVKGGEGSLAVLELFDKTDVIGYDENGVLVTSPNGVSDELDNIRKNGWLINQANLVFKIDNTTMANSYEPERIYLYDFTNSATVLDYYLDGTTINKNTSKYTFGGIITKDATSKRGVYYKINITNHIRNLVKNTTAKNIKLGVVVTEDVNIIDFYKLKDDTTAFMTQAPEASVMNPLGTVLYGGKSTVAEDKRLKLQIYYTKPN